MNLDGIKIEKGIPVPDPTRKSPLASLMGQMKVGDSFLLPPGILPRNLWYVANSLKIAIATRTLDNGNMRQVRVWRTQ